MRLIGWVFGLFLVLLLWPTVSEREPLLGQVALEQQNDLPRGNPLPEGWEVWAEGFERRRRPRPYRNPLRRLRKQMRWAARQQRRADRCALRSRLRGAAAAATAPLEKVEPEPGLIHVPLEPAPALGKRGRRPEVPTEHVFCPREGCRGYNQLGPHPHHRIVGAGTSTTTWGEKRQLFQCQWCKRRFSETWGTVFFGLKTSQETVYRALACLAEGMGLRATARIFEVEVDTILLWLRRAGQLLAKRSPSI